MDGYRHISNREFRRAEQVFYARVQDAITASGLTYTRIAKETGLERRTISRAAKGLGITLSGYARIIHFLENGKED